MLSFFCCGYNSATDPIPLPTGEPKDPLYEKGNMVDLIKYDPHINWYYEKLIRKNVNNKDEDDQNFTTTSIK
jgi:hypothetical protein